MYGTIGASCSGLDAHVVPAKLCEGWIRPDIKFECQAAGDARNGAVVDRAERTATSAETRGIAILYHKSKPFRFRVSTLRRSTGQPESEGRHKRVPDTLREHVPESAGPIRGV